MGVRPGRRRRRSGRCRRGYRHRCGRRGSEPIQDSRQRGEAAGAADDAQVEADIEEPCPAPLGLSQQHLQRIRDIGCHGVCRHEAVGVEELHVIGVERIGHDEQRLCAGSIPVGQIIVKGIGRVEEATLDQEGAGPGAFRAAAEEADRPGRPAAVMTAMQRSRSAASASGWCSRHGAASASHGPRPHGRPAPGWPAGRRALHRAPAAQPGRRHGMVAQGLEDAPEAGARAVGEDLFLPHVAGAGLHHAQHLADALARRIAVADLPLRTLLEVDVEADGEPRAVGPGEARPGAAVADEVARPAGSAPLPRASGCLHPRHALSPPGRRPRRGPCRRAARHVPQAERHRNAMTN